jgi:hypothetical protein
MKLSEQMIIDNEIKKLQHSLKLKFGLPPNSPSREDTIQIIEEMKKVHYKFRKNDKWLKVIGEVVESEGMYKYEGIDFSSVNNLLDQIEILLG